MTSNFCCTGSIAICEKNDVQVTHLTRLRRLPRNLNEGTLQYGTGPDVISCPDPTGPRVGSGHNTRPPWPGNGTHL